LKDSASDPRKFPFPPGIPVAAWLLGWGLGALWPIPLHWPVWTRWIGGFLFVAPWSIAIWAGVTFRRHKTPVDPLGKVTTIVTAGPFRYTRNPMYVSLMVWYVGGILLFHLAWSAVLLVPVYLALRYGVIAREERHLQTVFGEEYKEYCRRVRRWL
jgi:protein-S-isoprenylcysteine O-methyltransferase Ste14